LTQISWDVSASGAGAGAGFERQLRSEPYLRGIYVGGLGEHIILSIHSEIRFCWVWASRLLLFYLVSLMIVWRGLVKGQSSKTVLCFQRHASFAGEDGPGGVGTSLRYIE
jgi:hypothetical protein